MDDQNQQPAEAQPTMQIEDLKGNPKNPRIIDKPEFEALKKSIKEFGDLSCVVFNIKSGQLVGGHQRVEAFKASAGEKKIVYSHRHYNEPDRVGTVASGYVVVDGLKYPYREVNWDMGRENSANIAANRIQGRFDIDLLAQVNYEHSQLENSEELLGLTGQTEDEVKRLLKSIGVGEGDPEPGNMADDFIVPPFSILDTKQGYWQDRRNGWLAIGIKSELGREDVGSISDEAQDGLNKIGGTSYGGGSSVFDPVLCEIAYRWFNVPGGQVLDPFAGGSVRGVIASKLGMPYFGIDLSGRQLEANREQADIIKCDPLPVWLEGDSMNIEQHVGAGFAADFIFSCPPYADLEVYSDAVNDLSNMDYQAFTSAYWDIISRTTALLKDNRFAVFVVSEVRAKDGTYYNLVSDTIAAFADAGLSYYNELILVNSAGTLPLRAGKVFNAGRKIGRQHQNVLVFYKGDPRVIKEQYPALDFSSVENVIDNPQE